MCRCNSLCLCPHRDSFTSCASTSRHLIRNRICWDQSLVVPCRSKRYYTPSHDDVIKWKHFPRYCPFVRGIHRSPVNSPRKSQWRGALMFSLICARIKGWVNNGEAGDMRRHRAHYDVIVMIRGEIYCSKIVAIRYSSKKNRDNVT